MEQSTAAAPHVLAAINAVKHAMSKEGISKDRKNKEQGYQFRGIDDVYAALAPVLAENSLIIVPRMISRTQTERATANGKPLFSVVVEAEFDFVSARDGSRLEPPVRTFGEAMDMADKATNKAMSAAYKYAAFQTFCIPTEGDNDADGTTHNVRGQQRQDEAGPLTGKELDKHIAATTKKVDAITEAEKLDAVWNEAAAGLDTAGQKRLAAVFKKRKAELTQQQQG